MDRKFTANTIYCLSKEDADLYSEEADDGTRYEFAKSTDYAEGAVVADCWIQNERGDVHPGYNNSPVPLNINNVLRYIA